MTTTASELLRVPLRKRRALDDDELDDDELRAKRVAHERERVRRRAQETDDDAEQLEQGALVFSEAPLGVGYGCGLTHTLVLWLRSCCADTAVGDEWRQDALCGDLHGHPDAARVRHRGHGQPPHGAALQHVRP